MYPEQYGEFMLTDEHFQVLRDSLLFRDIAMPLLRDLLGAGSVCTLTRGETLFIQGDKAESIYIVLDGWVKLGRITQSGDDIVVAVYSRGESFGEAAAMKGGVYPVTVEVVEDATLFQVTAKTIAEKIGTHPEMAMAMLASTFRHLHELVLDIEVIKGHNGAQRLATFLVALAPVEEGASTFSLPYDKGLIAARLGMKPESLSRSISNLRGQGVTVRGGHVSVADVARLRDFIDMDRSGKNRAAPCA